RTARSQSITRCHCPLIFYTHPAPSELYPLSLHDALPIFALTVSGLRRRLGRTGLLRADEQRSWLAALELALPTAAGRDAVRRLQRIITQPGGPERALAAAQAVEDVWEQLRPPTTRAAS